MSWENLIHISTGLYMTVALTGGALIIGGVIGFFLMLLRLSPLRPVAFLALTVISVVRALPPLLWVFLIYFGLGSGLLNMSPFVAALAAFSMIAAVNLAEIFRGGLLSISVGQREAAHALGLSRVSTWWDILLPQLLRVAIPSMATYAIGLMKESAIASTIGVLELAYRGRQIQQLTFDGLVPFAVVGVFYILLSLPVAWASRFLENRMSLGVSR